MTWVFGHPLFVVAWVSFLACLVFVLVLIATAPITRDEQPPPSPQGGPFDGAESAPNSGDAPAPSTVRRSDQAA